MRVLISWLKEWTTWPWSDEELGHRLTMAGFEVEAMETFGAGLDKVVVGKILDIQKHPNADRLTLCKVDIGREILSIVCGAKNIGAGDLVPVALDGAKLPGGLEIKASKIRGEFSQGMMCSGKELNLEENSNGIWLLPKELELGQEIGAVLGLSDKAIELNITPNRPDALSIRGIAREVATLAGTAVKTVSKTFSEASSRIDSAVKIKINSPEGCPRYMARVVRGVKIGPSPRWLSQRLERMGHRSINNVVDVTNLILLELGQPLHAFDLDLLKGAEVHVRWAKEGEKIMAIDGIERMLDSSMLVIADCERPAAIAGVMGGKDTEVTEKTRNILIECACFRPSGIRRTSKSLGISSESSYRFERGVDFFALPDALDRAVELLQKLAGGEILQGVIDLKAEVVEAKKINFRPSRCRQILGFHIEDREILEILSRLHFKCEPQGEGWSIEVPSFRQDVAREVDLIEEVARLSGYDRIEEKTPEIRLSQKREAYSKIYLARERAREVLLGLGLNESIGYSFLDPLLLEKARRDLNAVIIPRPVRQDLSHMRTSLIPSLLSALALNQFRGTHDAALFEIARCYFPVRTEVETLSFALMGKAEGLSWKGLAIEADFFYLKGWVEILLDTFGVKKFEMLPVSDAVFHPGRAAQIMAGREKLGVLGEIHPEVQKAFELKSRIYAAEINFELLMKYGGAFKGFRDLPIYPAIERDIAILVDDAISHAEIVRTMRESASRNFEDVRLFDIYQGSQIPQGNKSLAYSLVFRSSSGTLKDEEVDREVDQIKKRLQEKLQCQFR